MYQKDTLSFKIDSIEALQQICFGIKRRFLPFVLQINKKSGTTTIESDTITIAPIGEYPLDSKYTKSIVVQCKPGDSFNTLEVTSYNQKLSITLVEPYIYRKK